MKILVTGYHGFVGQNLVPYLRGLGHEVCGLGRTGEYTWSDLTNEGGSRIAAQHFDAIIHLAGKAHDTKNQTAADVYFRVNSDLAAQAFSFFMAHAEIRTFIFFSSVKAAADRVTGEKLTEDAAPAPRGPYGESKAEAERRMLDMWRAGGGDAQGGGASPRRLYILRPCMMHGPGNKGNLNLLYRVVRTGMPWPLGAFENKRSFASIRNVCYCVGRLLEGAAGSGIYNLADDEALSTNELIATICKALGRPARILRFGRGAMTAAAKIGTRLHLPLNEERLAKLTENYVVDNSKIKRALGIGRMPVDTREGLIYTIKNFDK